MKWLICMLIAATLLIVSAVAVAQDTPPADPPLDTSGLDPETTPAPLPTMMERPAPVNSVRTEDGGTVMQVFFAALPQGTTGLIRVYGTNAASSPIQSVTAEVFDRTITLFAAEVDTLEDSFYGVVAAGMEQPTRNNYELIATITFADGSTVALAAPVAVTVGAFIRQIVTLPPDTAFLLDSETERNELARLESIFDGYTLDKHWDESGFAFPIANALTSPFGAFRTFNDTINTRHTGWDIRTTLGVPVMATAAGRVAYAGGLEIRGNHVIIDHGYGMFSGYSHLSQVHVTRGEDIAKGQIIGVTGATGRTSGPHFHWEMAVNGEWVDSVLLLQMWMP